MGGLDKEEISVRQHEGSCTRRGITHSSAVGTSSRLEECVTSQKEVRTLNKAILLFYSTHGMILLHQPTSVRCDAENDGVHAREDL